MRTVSAMRPAETRSRSGFTLLELLAVIAVIAVLLALLLPAILGGKNKGQIVQVKTEIGALTKAIADFKVKYGIEPPSSITLHEASGKLASPPATNWLDGNPDTVRSQAILSRFWPQIVLGGHDSIAVTDSWDFNGDGDSLDTFILKGSECLVFFLGGVVDTSGQPLGFSKNPANPFSKTGTNRESFFEFSDKNRLVPSPNTNFFGYADPIPGAPVPYLYVSSNEGQGYDAADFGDLTSRGLNATSVYRNGPTTSSPPWNPNGFQIISAGADKRYGGDPSGTGPFPFAGPYQNGELPGASTTARDGERDNITNFSTGVLVP